MADDWIKMRLDLTEDPAVIAMAERLEIPEEHVVGLCHQFWSWVSRNSYDGRVSGVSLNALSRVLRSAHFASALCAVGWLTYDDSGAQPEITIPNFDRHLSESAKSRALSARRMRKMRSADSAQNGDTRSATPAQPEKRREDKKRIKKKSAKRACEYDVNFLEFWSVYPKMRRQDKARAWKAWQTAIEAADPLVLIVKAADYAASPVGRGEYVKTPASWLNARCWEDDPQAWQGKSKKDLDL